MPSWTRIPHEYVKIIENIYILILIQYSAGPFYGITPSNGTCAKPLIIL